MIPWIHTLGRKIDFNTSRVIVLKGYPYPTKMGGENYSLQKTRLCRSYVSVMKYH